MYLALKSVRLFPRSSDSSVYFFFVYLRALSKTICLLTRTNHEKLARMSTLDEQLSDEVPSIGGNLPSIGRDVIIKTCPSRRSFFSWREKG